MRYSCHNLIVPTKTQNIVIFLRKICYITMSCHVSQVSFYWQFFETIHKATNHRSQTNCLQDSQNVFISHFLFDFSVIKKKGKQEMLVVELQTMRSFLYHQLNAQKNGRKEKIVIIANISSISAQFCAIW